MDWGLKLGYGQWFNGKPTYTSRTKGAEKRETVKHGSQPCKCDVKHERYVKRKKKSTMMQSEGEREGPYHDAPSETKATKRDVGNIRLYSERPSDCLIYGFCLSSSW